MTRKESGREHSFSFSYTLKKVLYYIPRSFLLTTPIVFFFYNVFHTLSKFIEIDITLARSIYIPICSIIFILLFIHFMRYRVKRSKLAFWLKKHVMKVLIFYFITMICIYNISPQAVMTAENVNNLLSTEWTMFGLSITIFLVWNVLIVSYFKNKQPTIDDKADYIEKYYYIRQKEAYNIEVEASFSSIILLGINVFLLICSSSLVYQLVMPEDVITQNCVRCTFYFSTNTILCLFIDILRPLLKDKADLIKESNVTKDELEEAKDCYLMQRVFESRMTEICRNPDYTNEEKRERILIFIQSLKQILPEECDLSPEHVDQLIKLKVENNT